MGCCVHILCYLTDFSIVQGYKAEGVDGDEAGGDRQQDGGVLQVTLLLHYKLLSYNRDTVTLTYV